MDKLLVKLASDYPRLSFVAGQTFRWSPLDQTIVYHDKTPAPTAAMSLLHEVGHGLLAHQSYDVDFELLAMEVAAWQEAKRLAGLYGIAVDEDHVQDCLDSYRDWLHRRSVCPDCSAKALQHDSEPLYRCFNCHAEWRVAPSRFCRSYRRNHLRAATA